jgi:hypothetical protein
VRVLKQLRCMINMHLGYGVLSGTCMHISDWKEEKCSGEANGDQDFTGEANEGIRIKVKGGVGGLRT